MADRIAAGARHDPVEEQAVAEGPVAEGPALEELHPALWRAHQLAQPRSRAVSTGHATLDAALPGGGWPVQALTELLLPQPGIGEIRLLAPALAQLASEGRSLMLFDPPAELAAVALAQLGIPAGQCVLVRSRSSAGRPVGPAGRTGSEAAGSEGNAGAGTVSRTVALSVLRGGRLGRPAALSRRLPAPDLLWALEQALRSGQVGAVLAWPGASARPEALRRLQLAVQSHDGPAFLLREIEARQKPSPALLRLTLHAAGPDRLAVHAFKRRGPAMARPLHLMLPPVLSPRAAARAAVDWSRRGAGVVREDVGTPAQPSPATSTLARTG